MSNTTFCLSVFNNLEYMKLCIESVRQNSHDKHAPFVIYAENCADGTNEWLHHNKDKYNLDVYIETGNNPKRGIGGGMNFCASKAKTDFINFLQADLYCAPEWDKALMDCYIENEKKDPSKKWVTFSYRVQPDIFNEINTERVGTVFVEEDVFGAYHDDFKPQLFNRWANAFSQENLHQYRKAEGVSGLLKRSDWEYIGGNDDRFAPAYWEDADLFIRMMNEGFDFSLTTQSVLYHFASRASRFPDDNLKARPNHLAQAEQNSLNEFVKKYGRLPDRDKNDMVIPMSTVDGSPNCIRR